MSTLFPETALSHWPRNYHCGYMPLPWRWCTSTTRKLWSISATTRELRNPANITFQKPQTGESQQGYFITAYRNLTTVRKCPQVVTNMLIIPCNSQLSQISEQILIDGRVSIVRLPQDGILATVGPCGTPMTLSESLITQQESIELL